MKVKLSTKPLSVAVGLVVGLVSVATIAAPTINVEATKNLGFVKTTKTVQKSIEYTLYALHGSCNGFFDI